MDFYFSESGDLKIASNGDIGMTEAQWRDDAQQAYTRVMTEPGDWVLYPTLGADLAKLYGMPQSMETGEFGKSIIHSALEREGRFAGKPVTIKATPTGPQTIRFDIYITNPVKDQLILSIEQSLGA